MFEPYGSVRLIECILQSWGAILIPAILRTPKSHWIEAASDVLAADGVEAVRVEALAARVGVTKGSFYAHFASREQLLAEVLDDWERRSIDSVLERVEARGGDAADRIHDAGVLTFGEKILPLDLAVRSWARKDADVRQRLRRVDNARMNFLRAQFRSFISDPDEVEARSILAFTLAIGCHFLAADLDAPNRGEAITRAGQRILFLPDR